MTNNVAPCWSDGGGILHGLYTVHLVVVQSAPLLYNWLVSLQSCFTCFSLPSNSIVSTLTVFLYLQYEQNVPSDRLFSDSSLWSRDFSQWFAQCNDGWVNYYRTIWIFVFLICQTNWRYGCNDIQTLKSTREDRRDITTTGSQKYF